MYWVEINRFFIKIFCFHAFGRVYQKLIWSAFFTINSFFKNSLNSHLFYGESLRFTFRRETWTSGETWDQREPEPTFGVNFHVSPLVHGSRHGVRRKLWCKNWNEGSCLTVVCTSLAWLIEGARRQGQPPWCGNISSVLKLIGQGHSDFWIGGQHRSFTSLLIH